MIVLPKKMLLLYEFIHIREISSIKTLPQAILLHLYQLCTYDTATLTSFHVNYKLIKCKGHKNIADNLLPT